MTRQSEKFTRVLIPGLGKQTTSVFYRYLIKRWANKRRSAVIFDTQWHTDESYANKHARLSNFLQNISGPIEIVAFSAGCPLAVSILLENKTKIIKLHLISGKLHRPESIGIHFQNRAPALKAVVQVSEDVSKRMSINDKAKIIIHRPLYDGLVPVSDMEIDGAQQRRIWMVFHAPSIALALLRLT